MMNHMLPTRIIPLCMILFFMILCVVNLVVADPVTLNLYASRASTQDTQFEISGTLSWSDSYNPEIGGGDKLTLSLLDGYVFPYEAEIQFTMYNDGVIMGYTTIILPRNTSTSDTKTIFFNQVPRHPLRRLRIASVISFKNQRIPQPIDINKALTSLKYTYHCSRTVISTLVPLYVSYPIIQNVKENPIIMTTTCRSDSECRTKLPYSLTIPNLSFNMTHIQYTLYGNDNFAQPISDDKLQDCYVNSNKVTGKYIDDKYTKLSYISIEYPFYSGYDYILTCPQLLIDHSATTIEDTYVEITGYNHDSPLELIATGHTIINHIYDPYDPILLPYVTPTSNQARTHHFVSFDVVNSNSVIKPSKIMMNFTSNGIMLTTIDIWCYPNQQIITSPSPNTNINNINSVNTLIEPINIAMQLKSDDNGMFPLIDIIPYITKYENISIHIIGSSPYSRDREVESIPIVQYGLDLTYIIKRKDGTFTDQYIRYMRADSPVVDNLSARPYTPIYNPPKPDDSIFALHLTPRVFTDIMKPNTIILSFSSPLLQFNANDGDMLECVFKLNQYIVNLPIQRLRYDEYNRQLPIIWTFNDDTDIEIPLKYDFYCNDVHNRLEWVYPQPARISLRLIGTSQYGHVDTVLDTTYKIKT